MDVKVFGFQFNHEIEKIRKATAPPPPPPPPPRHTHVHGVSFIKTIVMVVLPKEVPN